MSSNTPLVLPSCPFCLCSSLVRALSTNTLMLFLAWYHYTSGHMPACATVFYLSYVERCSSAPSFSFVAAMPLATLAYRPAGPLTTKQHPCNRLERTSPWVVWTLRCAQTPSLCKT